MKMHDIKWPQLLMTILIVCFLPWLAKLVIANGYALYVGFATRGDTNAIQEQISALSASPLFLIMELFLIGVVALWRSYALTRKGTPQVELHMLIAIAVAAVIQIIATITPGTHWIHPIIGWALAVVAAYAGTYLGRRGLYQSGSEIAS
jgi:cation transport ATPase